MPTVWHNVINRRSNRVDGWRYEAQLTTLGTSISGGNRTIMTARVTIDTWEGLKGFHGRISSDAKRRWLYRGQRRYDWDLKSGLERAMTRFALDASNQGEWEGQLLREFKRHLHRHTRDVPDDGDTARWLALMQHHGAPTRLLDFTYSFYAAVFFA